MPQRALLSPQVLHILNQVAHWTKECQSHRFTHFNEDPAVEVLGPHVHACGRAFTVPLAVTTDRFKYDPADTNSPGQWDTLEIHIPIYEYPAPVHWMFFQHLLPGSLPRSLDQQFFGHMQLSFTIAPMNQKHQENVKMLFDNFTNFAFGPTKMLDSEIQATLATHRAIAGRHMNINSMSRVLTRLKAVGVLRMSAMGSEFLDAVDALREEYEKKYLLDLSCARAQCVTIEYSVCHFADALLLTAGLVQTIVYDNQDQLSNLAAL
ncbi:hypothetical protein JOM56_013637 [Amanita muscaria]